MKRARLQVARSFGSLVRPASLASLLCLTGFASIGWAAGPDPAAETKALLAQLDKAESRTLVQDPLNKAKAAQKRAEGARGAGDLQHATELDALALTWAKVAEDLRRTAAAEKLLAEVQKSTADLEQKAVRTQALIEQTIARRGRAEQNLANGGAAPAAKPAPKVLPVKAKPAVKP